MNQALNEMKSPYGWNERLDVTCGPVDLPEPVRRQLESDASSDVHDDFKREMYM